MRVVAKGGTVTAPRAAAPGLSAMMPPVKINTKAYCGEFTLNICYTNDPVAVNDWLDEHCPVHTDPASTAYDLLGMDVEWKPVHTPGVFPQMALLQLATAWGDVLLFHVHHAPAAIPTSLERVCKDKRVLKVGVGILDDVMKIYSKWRVKVASYLDLTTLCRAQESETGVPLGPTRTSLLAFAQHFLDGCSNWKNKKTTCSNWEQWQLSSRQKTYASMDAFVGAAVFMKMELLQTVVDGLVKG
jgi:ribonuclease D